jgi:mannose-6-phosphate isomerase-like protein (cupin superfamily)
MKKMLGMALCLAPLVLFGQSSNPDGFHYWTKAQLEKAGTGPDAKAGGPHVKIDALGGENGQKYLMVHRDGRGDAEYHAVDEDVMFVQAGHGTLTYGGTLSNPRDTAENEKRAPGIDGGMEKQLAPGDVVTIPAKTPHQVTPRSGETIDYFVLKVHQ